MLFERDVMIDYMDCLIRGWSYHSEFHGFPSLLSSIYFELILTTLEASFIFWGIWSSSKNWLELKIEPPLSNLACLNRWNTLYVIFEHQTLIAQVRFKSNRFFFNSNKKEVKVLNCFFSLLLLLLLLLLWQNNIWWKIDVSIW